MYPAGKGVDGIGCGAWDFRLGRVPDPSLAAPSPLVSEVDETDGSIVSSGRLKVGTCATKAALHA